MKNGIDFVTYALINGARPPYVSYPIEKKKKTLSDF